MRGQRVDEEKEGEGRDAKERVQKRGEPDQCSARQKASWAGSSSRGRLFEAGLLPAVGLLVGDSESPVSSVESVQSSQFSPVSSI